MDRKVRSHERTCQASFSVVVTSSSGKAASLPRFPNESGPLALQAERAMLVVQGDPDSFRLAAKAAADGQPASPPASLANRIVSEHLRQLRLPLLSCKPMVRSST